jgi:hypothetical protein
VWQNIHMTRRGMESHTYSENQDAAVFIVYGDICKFTISTYLALGVNVVLLLSHGYLYFRF